MQCIGLEKLLQCCVGLSSSKVTEQRKNQDKFICLIDNNEVIHCLNSNSDLKKEPNWNTILRSLFETFDKACDAVSQKGTSGQIVPKTKVKKVRDTFALVKKVIRLGNSVAPRLDKLSKCLDYLVDCLLHRPELSEALRPGLVNLMISDLLACRKCICDISTDTYRNLYELCRREFASTGTMGKRSAASLLRAVTFSLVLYADPMDFLTLHETFASIIQGIKNERAASIQENILSAMNTYIKWSSVTYRAHACKLGEEVFDSVLCLWMKSSLSGTPLNLVIQFCSAQLSLHCPDGQTSDSKGAYAADPKTWHREVLSILYATEMQLKKHDTRFRYRFNTESMIESSSLIRLAGHACHVLFQLGSKGSLKAVASDSKQCDAPISSKLDFANILSLFAILPAGSEQQAVTELQHWLRIIHVLFQEHGTDFGEEVTEQFCSNVCGLAKNAQTDDLVLEAFKCMSVLLECRMRCLAKIELGRNFTLGTLWNDVWNAASGSLNKSSMPRSVCAALDLLTTLVKLDKSVSGDMVSSTGAIQNMANIWSSLFICLPPCSTAIRFILMFISAYGMDCTRIDDKIYATLLKTSYSVRIYSDNPACASLLKKFPFKIMILEWLFGYRQNVLANQNHLNGVSTQHGANESEKLSNITVNVSSLILDDKGGFCSTLLGDVLLLLSLISCKSFQIQAEFSNLTQIVDNSYRRPSLDTIDFCKYMDAEFIACSKHFVDMKCSNKSNNVVANRGKIQNSAFQLQSIQSLLHILQHTCNIAVEGIIESVSCCDKDHVTYLLRSYFLTSRILGYMLMTLFNAKDSGASRCEVTLQSACAEWFDSACKMMDLLTTFLQHHTSNQEYEHLVHVFLTGVVDSSEMTGDLFQKCMKPQSDGSKFLRIVSNICDVALVIVQQNIDKTKPAYGRNGSMQPGLDDPTLDSHEDEFTCTQSFYPAQTGIKRRRKYDGNDSHRTHPSKETSKFNHSCQCDSELEGHFCKCDTVLKRAVSVICTSSKNLEMVDKLLDLISGLNGSYYPSLQILFTVCAEAARVCSEKSACRIFDILKHIFVGWYKDHQVCSQFLEILDVILTNCRRESLSKTRCSVFDDSVGLLQVFWCKYYLKDNCSISIRSRILKCLSSVVELELSSKTPSNPSADMKSLSKNPTELEFLTVGEATIALFRFLTDSHDGIKILCSHVMQPLAEKLYENPLAHQALQRYALKCVNHYGHGFLSRPSEDGEQHLSVLSARLHVYTVIMPCAHQSVMKATLYEICDIAHSYFQNESLKRSKPLAKEMILSCLQTMYTNVNKSQENFRLLHVDGRPCTAICYQLLVLHLDFIFEKWIEKYSGKETNFVHKAIFEFPVSIFGCDSAQKFCTRYINDIFPLVFCHIKTDDELDRICKSFFLSEAQDTGAVKDIVTDNAAKIVSLLLSSEIGKGHSLQLLNSILGRDDALSYLITCHFPSILVNIMMRLTLHNSGSDDEDHLVDHKNLHMIIDRMCSWYGDSSAGKLPKMTLGAIVFSLTPATCVLAEVHQHMRKHIGQSLNAADLFRKLAMYKFFVSKLLDEKITSDVFDAYFVKDVVHYMAFHIFYARERLDNAVTVDKRLCLCRCSFMCLSTLLHMCTAFASKPQSLKYLDHWENATTLVNAVEILKLLSNTSVAKNVECRPIVTNIRDKVGQLADLLISIPGLSTCRTLLMYTQDTAIPREGLDANICSCMEDFISVCSHMKDYEISVCFGQVAFAILRKMSRLIESSTSEERAGYVAIAQHTVQQALSLMMGLVCHGEELKLVTANCISVLSTMVKAPDVGENSAVVQKQCREKFILDVLGTLSKHVVGPKFERSSVVVQCLYQLFQTTTVQSLRTKIAEHDSFLSAVLRPFMVNSSANSPCRMFLEKVNELESFLSTENIDTSRSHQEWICHLCSSLMAMCSDEMFRVLKPVCNADSSLCSFVISHIFHDVLSNDAGGCCRDWLSRYVRNFIKSFLEHFKMRENDEGVASAKVLLSVVQFLRTQVITKAACHLDSSKHAKKAKQNHSNRTSWENNFWLDIDFFHAAEAAVKCHQPWIAITFSEIWMDASCGALDLQPSSSMLQAQVSSVCPKNHVVDYHTVPRLQAKCVLADSYSMVDDVDCLHALCQGGSNDEVMVNVYEKEQNWGAAIHAYNHLMNKGLDSVKISKNIISSLSFSGLDHVSSVYRDGIQSKLHETSDNKTQTWLAELQYEAACKASKWGDFGVSDRSFCSTSGTTGFHQTLHECLSSLNDNDTSFISLIDTMKCNIIDMIQSGSDISWQNPEMLQSFAQLVCLKELTDVCNALVKDGQEKLPDLICDMWKNSPLSEDSILCKELHCRKTILSVRQSIVSVLLHMSKDPKSLFKLHETAERLLQMELAFLMSSGQSKVSLQLLDQLKTTVKSMNGKLQPYKFMKVKLCEAKLMWNMNSITSALTLSEQLCEELRKIIKGSAECREGCVCLLAETMQLRGQWLKESRMEGPSVIMQEYFQKSIKMAERLPSTSFDQFGITSAEVKALCVNGYKILARFADLQYQEVIEYMQSNEFERKRSLVRDAKEEMSKAQGKDGSRQAQKYMTFLRKNHEMDRKDFNDILDRKQKFLLSALEYYVKCLSVSDENDLLIYRMCSLWFANMFVPAVPGLIECACKQIPTFKFVQMSYQLAARLSCDSNEDFQATLVNLLHRMGNDHPYHVVPIILALANAHKDEELVTSGGVKRGRMQKTPQDSSTRVGIARSIVDRIKQDKPQLVSHMEQLSEAYIQLANYDASRWSKMQATPVEFDGKLLINKLCGPRFAGNFDDLTIPTVDVPLDKNCCYKKNKNIVTLYGFKAYFTLCGGINLPKILIATGSDGKEKKHLVKGRDDLRQDAVMQQVFQVVNSLLRRNKHCNFLQMRTYKVVPLTQCSGLVEWCSGTIPIGTYLIGTPSKKDFGAHHRYRPTDNLSVECRRKLSSVAGQPLHKKLSMFKDICSSFGPVMRHFFYEHFIDPAEWFQRRVSYSKSIATSSVIGYILGLGDRHVQNILIDCTTAELVHIDLGVAFEQGRCLPTPERVPFRLTQDIVDGLVTGIEGVFRRNCERTLSVMKESMETVSTIVEVLLHDPLHDWMMTSAKAMNLQRHVPGSVESESTNVSVITASTFADLLNDAPSISGTSSRNSLAARALLRVQEKLRGLESGTVLSVEGQINLLIQQSTDFERLCAMFAGWQPYL